MQKIEQIYRARLQMLVDEAGSQTALARRIEKSPAQISQWINASKDSKTGKPRAMDRATARAIEKLVEKPDGWMDQPIHDSTGAWPFHDIEFPRFDLLRPNQKIEIQGMVRRAIGEFEELNANARRALTTIEQSSAERDRLTAARANKSRTQKQG